jgi:hypothetical protein
LQVLISCLVELSVTSSVDRIGRPGFSFSWHWPFSHLGWLLVCLQWFYWHFSFLGVGLACQMKFFLRTNVVVSFLFFFTASAYAIGVSLGLTALIHRPGVNSMSLILRSVWRLDMMMVLIFLSITGLTWGAQTGFIGFPLWAFVCCCAWFSNLGFSLV